MTAANTPNAPTARDREVAEAAADLVACFRFAEAADLLRARVRELAAARETTIRRLFEEWCELDPERRPPFWDWSHGRGRDGGAPGAKP